jgi:hypothetical protein
VPTVDGDLLLGFGESEKGRNCGSLHLQLVCRSTLPCLAGTARIKSISERGFTAVKSGQIKVYGGHSVGAGSAVGASGGFEEAFGGDSASMGIFQLGIGPYIDASWTLSLILLLKIPQEAYVHLQQLRRAGREVNRLQLFWHDILCSIYPCKYTILSLSLMRTCQAVEGHSSEDAQVHLLIALKH